MSLHTELVELLPTKWSRWIAGSSILLSAAAYNLPSLLPESVLTMQPLTLFLLKLLLSATTLLLGSLVVLILVVRDCHEQSKIHAAEIEFEKNKHKTKISLGNSRRFNEQSGTDHE